MDSNCRLNMEMESASIRMTNAALLMSRCACAIVTCCGMLAENQIRERRGEAAAYDEGAFQQVILDSDISRDDAVWNSATMIMG